MPYAINQKPGTLNLISGAVAQLGERPYGRSAVRFCLDQFLMERNKHCVYILRSLKDGRLYTGYTSNLENRLRDHNTGHTKSLRNRKPLKLVYFEEFETKKEAMARERFFKTPEGGALKKKLMEASR